MTLLLVMILTTGKHPVVGQHVHRPTQASQSQTTYYLVLLNRRLHLQDLMCSLILHMIHVMYVSRAHYLKYRFSYFCRLFLAVLSNLSKSIVVLTLLQSSTLMQYLCYLFWYFDCCSSQLPELTVNKLTAGVKMRFFIIYILVLLSLLFVAGVEVEIWSTWIAET